MPAAVHVSAHPLIQHQMARLRAKGTPSPVFRETVAAVSRVLFFEAMADVRLRPVAVDTPLAATTCYEIAERVGLVPVLRAGLGMAEAMHQALPEASVWHIGLYRDHATRKPVTYYSKLPPNPTMDVAVVLDPMLATGGSAIEAIRLLKEVGITRIKFAGLIGAPEGLKALQDAHPDVGIYLAALDTRLNDDGYIVPGLGDAGDRQFGTA